MNHTKLVSLLEKVADLGRMSEADMRQVLQEIYHDGVVSRGEAEALFHANSKLSGRDRHWDLRFSEAVRDYLLTIEPPLGWVTEEESNWLMSCVTRSGDIPLETELDLMLDVLRYAEGAPDELGLFTLEKLCALCKHEECVSVENEARLRRAVYARAGDGATWVTRAEASCLFDLNDAVGFARNAASWNDLFARAIGNHLMAAAHPNPQSEIEALAREKWLTSRSGVGNIFKSALSSMQDGSWYKKVSRSSKSATQARQAAVSAALAGNGIDSEEKTWLAQRLGWEKNVSPAERALLHFLRQEAPGFAVGIAAATV